MSDITNVDMVAHELREQLDGHLAARDRGAAVRAIHAAVREGRIAIEDLYTRVLAPILRDTGNAWAQGAMQVWQEHFATATVRTIVEGLYEQVLAEAAQHERNGKVVVLACPSGEAHDMGLRMLTDRLTVNGWDAIFLGADTPTEEIVAAARALNADVVALSVATHYNRTLLREVMNQLKTALPGTRVGVGGPAFAADRDWSAEDLLGEDELGLSTYREEERS